MSERGLLITGATLLTMTGEEGVAERAADVRIRGSRIAEIAPDLEPGEGERVIDARGCAVLPGFVQPHIHLCQTLFRNLADDLSLLDWLGQRIWPLEASHTEESLRASAELGVAELLLSGTTGIVDMGTVHHTGAIFEVLERTGLRAIAGKCMMDDPGCPPGLHERTAASLAESVDLADRWDGAAGGRIRYGFAPRFALSCTEELLRDVAAEAARRGLFLHTHASENTDEVRLVLERSGGLDNILYLAELGIRGPETFYAHCIHVSEREIDELASAGSHAVHCPSSNLKLGSGVMDVPKLIERGVRVSIGADGAPCNNRLDMFTEMRTAALLQKPRHGPTAMPAAQVLRMATRGGAEALGLAGEAGQLAEGFLADLIVLEPDPLLTGPGGSWASRIVYAATRASVKHVVVDGALLVEDRALTRASSLDAEELARRAASELAGCIQRAGF